MCGSMATHRSLATLCELLAMLSRCRPEFHPQDCRVAGCGVQPVVHVGPQTQTPRLPAEQPCVMLTAEWKP